MTPRLRGKNRILRVGRLVPMQGDGSRWGCYQGGDACYNPWPYKWPNINTLLGVVNYNKFIFGGL